VDVLDRARARVLADPEIRDRGLARALRQVFGYGGFVLLSRPGSERRARQEKQRRAFLQGLADNLTATRNGLLRDTYTFECVSAARCGTECGTHARTVGGCADTNSTRILLCPGVLARDLAATLIHEVAHTVGIVAARERYLDDADWSRLPRPERLTMASAIEHFAMAAGR
jgi:hypothetical protein